jgi:cell wall assembly regulator SMI1
MMEFKDERPPVSAETLETAERQLAKFGHTIPPSYRKFLAEQDGGKPVRRSFSFQHDGVEQRDRVRLFFGIAPSPNGDLVSEVRMLGNRVPPGVLPIGGDSFGNLVCLDGRNGRDGPVLFWDHEYEGDPPDEANLYEIAPDLQTFLDSLTEPTPPTRELSQRHSATGWRRLFGRG